MNQSRIRGPEPLIRVGDDFEDEYPGASALATECFANLWRAAELLMGLHNRHTTDRYQLSPSGRGVLESVAVAMALTLLRPTGCAVAPSTAGTMCRPLLRPRDWASEMS